MRVLGIDPGTFESAYVLFDGENILNHGKVENESLLNRIVEFTAVGGITVAIEEIRSYGMAVGAEVFKTCWWSGRFFQAVYDSPGLAVMIPRKEVCKHVCNNAGAKDPNVRQAMLDRFGAPGTKKAPGKTYGISKDVWSALAISCTQWDRLEATK